MWKDYPADVRFAAHVVAWSVIASLVLVPVAVLVLVLSLDGSAPSEPDPFATAAASVQVCHHVPNGKAHGWHAKCSVRHIPENVGRPLPPVRVVTF